ncbi:MAG: hypothetical protein KAI47_10390 [Deltaproteobacteria bacterium]|nr:hypothetical protein [Deltaproteobacteria bacterium]
MKHRRLHRRTFLAGSLATGLSTGLMPRILPALALSPPRSRHVTVALDPSPVYAIHLCTIAAEAAPLLHDLYKLTGNSRAVHTFHPPAPRDRTFHDQASRDSASHDQASRDSASHDRATELLHKFSKKRQALPPGYRDAISKHFMTSVMMTFCDIRTKDDLAQFTRWLDTLDALTVEARFAVLGLPPWAHGSPVLTELLARCDAVVAVPNAAAGPSAINRSFRIAAQNLLDGQIIHGFIGYDFPDLLWTTHLGDLFTLAWGRARRPELASDSTAATDLALAGLRRQGVDFSSVASVHLAVRGGEEIALMDIDVLSTRVLETIPADAQFVFYCVIDADLGNDAEISILVAPARRKPWPRGHMSATCRTQASLYRNIDRFE